MGRKEREELAPYWILRHFEGDFFKQEIQHILCMYINFIIHRIVQMCIESEGGKETVK